MLTLQHIANLQKQENEYISVSYFWETSSNIPVAKLKKVWIFFKKPHPKLWKYIMTQTTDNFEIGINGTRNQIHDGLDECYLCLLDEVNKERLKINLAAIKLT